MEMYNLVDLHELPSCRPNITGAVVVMCWNCWINSVHDFNKECNQCNDPVAN